MQVSRRTRTAERRGSRRGGRRSLAIGVAALAVVAVMAVVAGSVALGVYRGALRSNVGELSFRNQLRIPPLAAADVDRDGRRSFTLQVAAGTSEFHDGVETPTWGVDGPYLGPTLRARRGETVSVRVANDLGESTTIHWHGMHLPAAADGGPHQPIGPGDTWSASWTVDQPAATLWYHAHPAGRTGEHVYRGVAGLFLVDDGAAASLPSRYGVDDIPLILQDRSFADDGALDLGGTRFSPIGPLGDEILVNGTYDPFLSITTVLVRLRVLNASNARTFNLGFSDDRPFWLVATDGGLLPAPVELRRLLVAPSERVELLVRFDADDDVVLRSYPTRLGGGRLPARFAGGDDSFDLVEVVAPTELDDTAEVPDALPAPAPVRPGPEATVRRFSFNHASRINGRSYDADRIDFSVEPGSVEVWELDNDSDNQHVFHVHGVSFSVIEYDGRSPPPHLSGRKDSLLLPPGASARIAVAFTSYVDADRPLMYHCHLLAHEDHGMMGQFTVG